MKCEICGIELPTGSSFCTNCGIMQDQRFEKQFKEKNTFIPVDPYLAPIILDCDSKTKKISPCMCKQKHSFHHYKNKTSPCISLQNLLTFMKQHPCKQKRKHSIKNIYTMHQTEHLKKLYFFSLLYLTFTTCLIFLFAFFKRPDYFYEAIYSMIVLICLWITHDKCFVKILLLEKIILRIVPIVTGFEYGIMDESIISIPLLFYLLYEMIRFEQIYEQNKIHDFYSQ